MPQGKGQNGRQKPVHHRWVRLVLSDVQRVVCPTLATAGGGADRLEHKTLRQRLAQVGRWPGGTQAVLVNMHKRGHWAQQSTQKDVTVDNVVPLVPREATLRQPMGLCVVHRRKPEVAIVPLL